MEIILHSMCYFKVVGCIDCTYDRVQNVCQFGLAILFQMSEQGFKSSSESFIFGMKHA